MATSGDERNLLSSGVQQDGHLRGSWAQNLWQSLGSLSVRPGWGVRAELDTTLSNNVGAGDQGATTTHMSITKSGYDQHLGSALVKTNFGHTQILSVFSGKFFPGNLGADPRNERFDNFYAIRIYDLNTNRSWEEMLYRTTAEMLGGNQIIFSAAAASHPSEWYGNYETSFEVDNSGFVSSDFNSEWFFHVDKGEIYFGSSSIGMFTYRPADFYGYRHQQLGTSNRFDWHEGYSESSLISRIHFGNGVFEEGFVYADGSNINKIVAAASFRGRLVYATEYEIWFADEGRPNNVIARNFISVPSQDQVTAMHELHGNLIIFTDTESFLYIPSEGTIVSQGRPPIKISENVGCIGQRAITKIEGSLVWVSNLGIHMSSDGRSIKELSEPIRSFWDGNGLMTNPMTSYFEANSGYASISSVDPPRTLLTFDKERVTLAYNHKNKALIMGCPNINGCWAFTGMWSWWPMESSVSKDGAGNPTVAASRNLTSPWVMANSEDIYSVCGIDDSAVSDASNTIISASVRAYPVAPTDVATPLASSTASFVVTELGYGGAIDRSSFKEDGRIAGSRYLPVIRPDAAFEYGAFYFEEAYMEKDILTGAERYWVPVSLLPPVHTNIGGNPIQSYELFFAYDSAQWNPEPTALPNSDISLRYSTERLVSHSASGSVVSKVTDATGAANPVGGHIHIKFDGTAAAIPASSWTYQPNLNVVEYRKNPLFEIGFLKSTTASVNGFYIWPKTVGAIGNNVKSSSHTVDPMAMLVWSQQFIGTTDSHNDNAKAQAVDWAYKSAELSNNELQIKARGIYAKLNSRGRGLQVNRLVPNWVWGLYNVVLGSDSKDYTSQVIDYDDNIQKIENKTTIRSRMRNSAGDMEKRTFGNPVGATWGRDGTPGDGNYLIDDQETDDIATSDSVKGQRISYMVFGFIQDRAESLSIQRLIGVFRRGGRRRRTGR